MIGAPAARRVPVPIPWTTLIFFGLWTWAIWSCAEHWRGNPNYSYGWVVPILALGFGLRRSWQIGKLSGGIREERQKLTGLPAAGLAITLGGLVFCLEFAREQVWHPQIILTLICLLAAAFGSYALNAIGGSALFRAEVFPVLFFFTAVPWPPRIEQPVTTILMRGVASSTAELLHWVGVEAQTSGGAIALRAGLVGITEACSGIRSVQAGIMFGLAVGEWFLLRPTRRIFLLAMAVALALLTNLGRTLALALQAEWHGLPAVEKAHDLIGNAAITFLIVGLWLIGKWLSPRASPESVVPLREGMRRTRELIRRLLAAGQPALAAVFIASLIGFISARGVNAAMEMRDHTQVSAFFYPRANPFPGQRLLRVPKEIWDELRPTTGEYIRREDADLPRGAADLYHFFWKPSPWNRFALVHRPDICMPGIGWQLVGSPEPLEVDFDGRQTRCYLFRFQRGEYRALQLWGVWRNGVPLSLDYQVSQIFGQAEPPSTFQLEGKRRSATEIVACSLIDERTEPNAEMAAEVLRSVFEFKPK